MVRYRQFFRLFQRVWANNLINIKIVKQPRERGYDSWRQTRGRNKP